MHRTRVAACLLAAALLATLAIPSAAGALDLNPSNLSWQRIGPLAAPSWYTPELHRQAVAAGPNGVTMPEGADIPTSSLAFLGIRPGVLMLITSADGSTLSLCTSNFVFNEGSQYYIGTAGHCGEVGDSVDMLFLPDVLANVGEIVMSTGDDGVGNDFALVKIDQSFNGSISPSMAHLGGPTGVYTGDGPTLIGHSGWGLVVGTGGTPRVGVGIDWTPNEWLFEGIITFGDSGSAATVLPSGLAAGNITHIAVRSDSLTVSAGTSIQKILRLVDAFDPGVELATCASAIPWPLPGCPS